MGECIQNYEVFPVLCSWHALGDVLFNVKILYPSTVITH